MKASDLFLRCLEAQGVEVMFGVPGEENADIMISLLNSSIDFVTCRHEQEAAFMADMYGRLKGKPAVCLSTLGPGATNMITGVSNANMDHVPLVAVIGQASTHRLHKQSHQNMNAIEMYKPVSKWAVTVRDADVIPEIIQKAFKLSMSAKPGACVIELPEDIAGEEVVAQPLCQTSTDYALGVPVAQVNHAMEILADCQAPIMLVGAGCTRAACDPHIKALLDHMGMYAATTFMGKGVVPDDHAQSLYCVGLGMKDIAMKAFDKADCVVCVGYDMVEWHPEKWNQACSKRIIHIDSLPAEVDKDYVPTVELVGQISDILDAMNQRLTEQHKKDPTLFAGIRQEITAELMENEQDISFPVKPQRALADTRSALAKTDILISDVGAHKMWVARQYPAYHSKTCFIYNGFCSMGGAMPGAFVAKRLYPEKNVVALCGDGGFIMSIQALVTAVEKKVPMIVIVWQDDGYGLIKWKQEMTFHQYSHVDLTNPNLCQLAQSLGCVGTHIDSADQLKPALHQAFTVKDKPSVIVLPIDYRENMKLTQRLGAILCH